ncbi:MAG: hypothetical protein KC994_09775, partial [Candidatus Omnitrophica bacterium]|nr:hypothetical protein [Candidatus Omnitrophota bacterium]
MSPTLLFLSGLIFLGAYCAYRLTTGGAKPSPSQWVTGIVLLGGLILDNLATGMATKGLLICLLPLLSFWVLMFFGRNHLPSGGDWIAMIAIGLSLCLSYSIYHQAIGAYESGDEFFYHQSEGNIASFEWIAFTNPDTGERTPWKLGFWIDSLTAIMLMVVAGISFLVHLFSLGYMKGEENYSRYFGYLGIFSFSMLLLVLTDNLFVLYICWELVGVSSFLLIGFFINKDSAAAAAKKAFLTNRVGDLGFAIGLF